MALEGIELLTTMALADLGRGQLNLDAIFFHVLTQRLAGMRVALTERELTYLGVERWLEGRPLSVQHCGGEPPFVYAFDVPGASEAAASNDGSTLPRIPPGFYPVVDLVHHATGAGIGIRAELPHEGARGEQRQDPRTGRRLRYRYRPIGGDMIWVERTELGRGPGFMSHGGSHGIF